jgi:hypothetical protein
MSENSRAFTQSLYGFDAVVRRINSEQWANQSPCEKWDARAVVDHVVFACVMIGGLAEGRNAAVPRTDEDGLLPAMIEDHSTVDQCRRARRGSQWRSQGLVE